MWVETHRPRDAKDVVGQEEILKTLLGAADQGRLPHLLLYGPPGTGKTSTILAIARRLYHPSVLSERVLEMNASDERGIKIVREKIKSFAQRSVSGAKLDGFPSPSFKIIILDEADTMTKEAQGALRRIMETYSNVTRFCLICNYVSRIIEPLVSRCSKLRFATLDHESMRMRLHVIAGVQDIAYDEAVYEKILNYSGGDMRRAVMLFQSCVICYGSKGPITTDVLEGISGEIPSLLMKSLWISAKQKDFAAMSGIIVCIMLQGYSATCCLSNIHDAVLANTMIHDEGKAIIFEAIAAADKNVSDGANADLQLRAVCSCICERRPSQ